MRLGFQFTAPARLFSIPNPEPSACSRPPWNPSLVILLSPPCAVSEVPLPSAVSPAPLEAARHKMTRGRRHSRPAAPATLPDNDDILSEILLRLPPRPSSLPRASLVCKRWHRLITDPHFRRRFRSRHPNPHLIGFFDEFVDFPFFRSVMDPPDLSPPMHFCPPILNEKGGIDPDTWRNFGCRHGRVFLYNRKEKEIVVWDPPTGDHHRVAVPLELDDYKERIIWNGAVLCAAASDHNHIHGSFSSCPFKVAVVGVTLDHTQVFACIYSSQTGNWSNLVSAAVSFKVLHVCHPGVMVGNALYWMHLGYGCGIAEFDLDTHTLALVECPPAADFKNGRGILVAQNGVLCLAFCSGNSIRMWERNVCSEGVANWVLRKSDVVLQKIGERSTVFILGYADDINVMALWINGSCYSLQLNSLQLTKLWETRIVSNQHPYASIYDSGLYSEMDKEELIEGVNIMLRVAESRLAAQCRTEGGAKQPTDEEHLEEDSLLAAQRRTAGAAKQPTDEQHLEEDNLLAAQRRTTGGAKQLTDEQHLEEDDMSE